MDWKAVFHFSQKIKAHWGLRGILVEKSSNAAEFFIDELGKLDFN